MNPRTNDREAVRRAVGRSPIRFATLPLLGRQIGDHTQFELGYLYRYDSVRTGADQGDHAIHLGLTVNTKGKVPPHKPHARDKFR